MTGVLVMGALVLCVSIDPVVPLVGVKQLTASLSRDPNAATICARVCLAWLVLPVLIHPDPSV